ncbi:Nn.00g096960.m01.CDS01 [Neocucurbitaria sp. VM-36]
MDQQQVNRILDAIRALDNKVDLVKAEINSRFDNFERRLINVEGAVLRLAGPNALPAVPAPPSFPAPPSIYQSIPLPPPAIYGSSSASHGYSQSPTQGSNTRSASRAVGSRQNASFLPYAMEMIARASQRKQADDQRKCGVCGAPTFDTECFRKDHFRWCRVHHRPILRSYTKCGRDYDGCSQVVWEHHADWELLVQQSYRTGYLGKKGVEGLDRILFPRDLYPQKYDDRGRFIG